MSSGYVTTNIPVRPDRVRNSRQSVQVSFRNQNNTKFGWSLNDHRWLNPITSFRSGPSFERSLRKPGAILSERNLGEFYAAESGDFGHEFSMRRVTAFYGGTTSKRPASGASTSWSTLTNPTPMWFTTSTGGGMDVSKVIDSTYGFAKTDSQLKTIGTSFIKATNPIQSQVNLLSDIAEAVSSGFFLPELLGKSIVGSVINPNKRKDIIKAVGGEYLNYIFGYKPLADDIAKVGSLIDTVNDLIDQWIKDNGTIVRRRRKVKGKPIALLSGDINIPGSAMANGFTPSWIGPVGSGLPFSSNESQPWSTGLETSANMANVSASGFYAVTSTSDISFSAGYEYDLTTLVTPLESDDASAREILHSAYLRGQLLEIAFGLDSASISRAAFDATPFSWLLDWFVNIGDVIDNFRGLQSRGVQMLWGYISETVTRDYYMEYNLTWNPTQEVFFRTYGLSAQKAIRRVRATPFGFGTSFDSLTADQTSTLAALLAAKS